jgi:hypothetical protein
MRPCRGAKHGSDRLLQDPGPFTVKTIVETRSSLPTIVLSQAKRCREPKTVLLIVSLKDLDIS